jgi:NADH-quinone oxidoreductase subunit H
VWGIVYAPIPALIFFVTSIAEVGRAPFDLMEAESELIAGFNIEYSGIKFGFFYVADFLHAFTTAMLFSVLFLGGWQGPAAQQIPVLGFVYFVIKTSVVYLFSVLVRATLPRLRIDQMMNLNWKFFTPLSIGMVMLTALLGKLLPVNPGWAQPVGMLAANLVVGALAWRYAERAESRPRPEVAPANPPFAHWLPPASGGQEGGQA